MRVKPWTMLCLLPACDAIFGVSSPQLDGPQRIDSQVIDGSRIDAPINYVWSNPEIVLEMQGTVQPTLTKDRRVAVVRKEGTLITLIRSNTDAPFTQQNDVGITGMAPRIGAGDVLYFTRGCGILTSCGTDLSNAIFYASRLGDTFTEPAYLEDSAINYADATEAFCLNCLDNSGAAYWIIEDLGDVYTRHGTAAGPVAELNTNRNETSISLTDGGSTMYLVSDRDGEMRVYRSEYAGSAGSWGTPTLFEPVPETVSDVFVTDDHEEIYYTNSGGQIKRLTRLN